MIEPASGKEDDYARRLPMTSEQAIEDAIDAGVATKIDTHFYFVCAVVNPNAADH